MKKLMTIFSLSFFIGACGEQFQGTFEGQATLTEDTCGFSDTNGLIDIALTMRLSGDSTEFLITEFKNLDPTSPISSNTSDYLRGLRLFADIQGNNRIVTVDSTYKISESIRTQIAKNLNNDLTEADLLELQSDEIFVNGSIRSDRELIETFDVDIFTQTISGQELIPCKISFNVVPPGLTLVK